MTSVRIDYEGSLSLDKELMQRADILPFEKIEVYNISNGARFSTYAIPSEENGEVALNGAAARLGAVGDLIIIATFVLLDEKSLKEHKPKLVFVDEKNRPREE
ncbi:MAG: aspartate 1-decarboxylase [Aquificaceae bacterium]|nr:aspartate 1-decarboxylase [Aquificaceae bacterium]